MTKTAPTLLPRAVRRNLARRDHALHAWKLWANRATASGVNNQTHVVPWPLLTTRNAVRPAEQQPSGLGRFFSIFG